MMPDRAADYLLGLVRELCALPRESEWVECKLNDAEPQAIGEYISALANSAALEGKASAYVIWGVRDEDHAVLGTTFDPRLARSGQEELQSWILRLLEPRIEFRFHTLAVDGNPVVVLEIPRAIHQPVRFSGQEYIRVGTYKKKLRDFPEKERALWRTFDRVPFEDGVAAERASAEDVLRLLDCSTYFDLLALPLPATRDAILGALVQDRLVAPCAAGGWDITNLGALLFAKTLKEFPRLRRKAPRVVQYRGTGRAETLKEQEGQKGYASGFEGLLGYVEGLVPVNEVVGRALRKTVPMFPQLAIRELVANALIHQDLSATGAGPMVEIFADRMEITNPGEPLVDTARFLDSPPQSRNDALAALMRRLGICEERGSGIDKVLGQVELYQLPAPLFEAPAGFTRVALLAHKALEEGAIVLEDPSVGTRLRRYLPSWAAASHT